MTECLHADSFDLKSKIAVFVILRLALFHLPVHCTIQSAGLGKEGTRAPVLLGFLRTYKMAANTEADADWSTYVQETQKGGS